MIRDNTSNALLSTDVDGIDKYRMEKRRITQINQLEQNVRDLNNRIDDLMLRVKSLEEK